MLQRLLLSSLAPLWLEWAPPADLQRLLLMRPPVVKDLGAHWADFARHVRKMGCTPLPPEGGATPDVIPYPGGVRVRDLGPGTYISQVWGLPRYETCNLGQSPKCRCPPPG